VAHPSAGAVCGNGIREGAEQCDDGNRLSGDGCDGDCKGEGIIPPAPAGAVCGNGKREDPEQCDDGNISSGDGCDFACRTEPPKPVKRLFKITAHPEKRVNATQNRIMPSGISFYNRDLRKFVFSGSVQINNLGWGALETYQIPDGTYDISLKGLSHLTRVIRGIVITNPEMTLDFTDANTTFVTAGDVHESKDDFINGLDISATAEQLYTSTFNADLNHDGIVNSLDLSIVIGNIYKRGQKI
jgi:cysteine-rich repeat protein